MSALGIDHVGLTVRDIDRALRFWRDVLGFEVVGRGVVEWEHIDRLVGLPETKIEWVGLRLADGTVVELQQHHRRPGPPLPHGEENEPGRSHLSLKVDDVDRMLKRALAEGFTARSPEPVPMVRGSFRGSLGVYLIDGDGYNVELIQHPEANPNAAGS